MHVKRWLTALVGLPLLFTVIRYGGEIAFAILILAAALLGLREYYGMVLSSEQMPLQWTGVGAAVLLVCGYYMYGEYAVSGAIALLFMGMSIMLLFRFGRGDGVADLLARLVCGIIYIPFLLAHLILIRNQDDGIAWVFFVFSVVFALDTCAYYAGTYAGRHKLYPAVSPKKTWEGTVGGLLGALLTGALFKAFFLTGLEWPHLIVLTTCMGVFGVIGDLIESMIKRSVNVKDSGALLPGHGGILDRIDALLFVAPIVYYYKLWLMTS